MHKPPKFFLKLFRWYCDPRLVKPIEGDLMELYDERVKAKGKQKANWLFIRDVLLLIRKDIIRPAEGSRELNAYGLFKHNLKTGSRSLIRDKAYTTINVLGLAIGMAVCLSIFQYVYFQLNYDTFHFDHENTYRVIIRETNSNTQEAYPDGIGYGFGLAAAREVPGVKKAVRKGRVNITAAVTNPENKKVFYEEVNDLLFVDHSFFEMFNFPLIRGNKASLFADDYNIVITEKAARKYFGREDPMGKTLVISGPPSPGKYTVSGVLQDPPLNGHLQFDFLMPLNNYLQYGWGGAVKRQSDWTGFEVVTYLTLDELADLSNVVEKLNTLIARNTQELEIKKEVVLQPIADIYLKSGSLAYPGYINETGDIQNILILCAISFLIILIAWTNYINLATSQSLKRAKEVGIRKTLGARRKNLISQFILESLLMNAFAAVLAIGFAFLLLPVLNEFIGKELKLSLLYLPNSWIGFLSVVLMGGLLAGTYPAFILSNFRPINALKNKVATAGNVSLKKGLIVFQFLASLLLISATYLVYRQVTFLKDQELNTNLETVLLLKGPSVVENQKKGMQTFNVFQEELAKNHKIETVCGSARAPGEFWIGGKLRNLNTPVSEAPHSRGFGVTRNFDKTYGLVFLAGGGFTKAMLDKSVCIINESALATYDFESAEEAMNQTLFDDDGGQPQTIVGVVKDFHWHSLREDHQPYVLNLFEERMPANISIKLNASSLKETLTHIETNFKMFFPGNPFEYSFADKRFNQQYQAEQQFAKLFFFFSTLAIFIGCVGLFALVSYSVNSKVKEIGIRKVLGASVDNIVMLLSRDYFQLIFIAIGIAIPVVWIGGKAWLDHYANRISIGVDILVVPAIVLVFIAILTVSYRTIRSASANPVESLRDE